MTEMFGEAWPPMSVPDLAPDDDDYDSVLLKIFKEMMKLRMSKPSEYTVHPQL